MQIQSFVFSPFQENTYVIHSQGEAMIIDPGCYFPNEEQALQSFIEAEGLRVRHLINTHLHLDHIFGNAFVCRTWELSATACLKDLFWLDSYPQQCALFGIPCREPAPPIGQWLEEGDTLTLGDETFQVLQVPGHSPGSLALYHSGKALLFAGDVLFQGSVGRSDLKGGNHDELIRSIREKLLVLPDETTVYSGHGPTTTIGAERRTNPFL